MSNNYNFNNSTNARIVMPNMVPKSSFIFVSQPQQIQNQQGNQNLFGAPLIPVINEIQISATQRIKQVENEVKREKEMNKVYDENELLKLVPKCEFHPNKLSDKCRYDKKYS